MSERWDAWKDGYDDWKLATPPEYEITAEEEQELFEREQEEREAAEQDARELAEYEAWEAKQWRVLRWLQIRWNLSRPGIRLHHWRQRRRMARAHKRDFSDEIPF